ncbi:hypothetical protein GGE68_005481 [Rhizobium leguminosarum]|nr:hypothetical protein [Rhizobium leguminosarum]
MLQISRQRFRLLAGCVFQDDAEFVSSHAGDRNIGRQGAEQDLGDTLQDRVPLGVAECVVDELETVEIEGKQRQRAWCFGSAGNRHLETLVELAAVRQAGQWIMARHMLDPTARLMTLRQIAHGDHLALAPAIFDRPSKNLDRNPILAVAQHRSLAGVDAKASFDRKHRLDRLAFQKCGCFAGHRSEFLVEIDDDILLGDDKPLERGIRQPAQIGQMTIEEQRCGGSEQDQGRDDRDGNGDGDPIDGGEIGMHGLGGRGDLDPAHRHGMEAADRQDDARRAGENMKTPACAMSQRRNRNDAEADCQRTGDDRFVEGE